MSIKFIVGARSKFLAGIGRKIWADTKVEVQKMANVGIRVPLPLIKTFKLFLISLSLLIKERLWQIYGLGI